jgi:RNA polymerase sigma factor (sigma-70 family)
MARSLEELTTDELVASAAQPIDQEGFGNIVATLMLRFKNQVYAQALHLSRQDRSLADDVFQETFLRIFQFLRDRQGRPPVYSFAGLVRVVATRATIDILRSQHRSGKADADAASVHELASNESGQSLDQVLYARQLMEELDQKQQQILSLIFIEGLTTREVATQLGLKANHVRQLKFRALERIRLRHAIDNAAQMVDPL